MESFEFDLDKALDELEKLDAEEAEIKRNIELDKDENVIKEIIENLILKIEWDEKIPNKTENIVQEECEENHETISEEDKLSNQEILDITSHQSESEIKINQKTCQSTEKNEASVLVQVTDYKSEWDQLTDSEKTLGLQAPVWLPDSETNNCLKCGLKFTFRKRRHHCRACGLIFCSSCCSEKLELPFRLDNSETTRESAKNELSRVCLVCFKTINRVNELKEKINQIENSVPIVSVLKKAKSSENTDLDQMAYYKRNSFKKANIASF